MMQDVIIRKTSHNDIDAILVIYDKARAFMRSKGNKLQWNDGYPSRQTLENDMAEGNSYVIQLSHKVIASFYFKIGIEPTYAQIYDGKWHNTDPYGVIHRAASDGMVKGIMKIILDFCFVQCHNIRIDTHRDNKVMQDALLRYGFSYCGIIYLSNGDERLAYQYVK